MDNLTEREIEDLIHLTRAERARVYKESGFSPRYWQLLEVTAKLNMLLPTPLLPNVLHFPEKV